jgi:hypothetical protein
MSTDEAKASCKTYLAMTASCGASQNSDKVAVAHHHVELLHLAAHVCQKLLGRFEPARRIRGGLDAGIGQAEERDLGGHRIPAPHDRASSWRDVILVRGL